ALQLSSSASGGVSTLAAGWVGLASGLDAGLTSGSAEAAAAGWSAAVGVLAGAGLLAGAALAVAPACQPQVWPSFWACSQVCNGAKYSRIAAASIFSPPVNSFRVCCH